jgi:hypothetical protein
MITAVIFSKNRACQLDLCLSSIIKNCNIFEVIRIVYTYDEEYKKGYEIVFKKYANNKNVSFVKEDSSLVHSFLVSLDECKTNYISFITDDTVFYEETNPKDSIVSAMDGDTFCFSLRLGLNTKLQDYKTGRYQSDLIGYEKLENDVIRWDYNDYNPFDNYGYPISLDGHIYRKDDVVFITSTIDISKLRDWEGKLCYEKRYLYSNYTKMASFKHSKCVNIPSNAVLGDLYCSDKGLSVAQLEEKFISGNDIDIEKMDFTKVIGCHQEIDYRWKND